jgi:hypothetical protein
LRAYFFFGFALAGFEVGFSSEAASFWSPMTPFSGQTLNTGHFWQPTVMATGQMTMVFPFSAVMTGQ